MTNFKSYKGKIVDFGIRSASFTNDSGEEIAYKQTVLTVDIDGEVEDLVLSGSNAVKPKTLELSLRGAKTINPDQGILGDDDV